MPYKKILFFVKSLRFLRYFKSVVEALLRRGFAVHIVFDSEKYEEPSDNSLEQFKKEHPLFSWENGPLRTDRWARFIIACRNIRNYAFLVRIRAVKRHTDRMFQYLPVSLRKSIARMPFLRFVIALRPVDFFLSLCEYMVPPDISITNYIRAARPSAILVSYRNFPCTSPDIDYLKSARKLRIPAATITPSWDNLTTKSLIQVKPDAVLVWNEEHAHSVHRYHHIPKETIKIVGAPQFDAWFERRVPFQIRERFIDSYGLDPNRKFLLYISSASAGRRNPNAIHLLREACNASTDPLVRTIHILVRPYPGYEGFSAVGNIFGVTVLPAPAEGRRTLQDDALFYDSIFHSFAVIALDSAAFFDVMAVGRPGIVYRDAHFSDIQSAEHFSALMGRGALYEANSGYRFTSLVSRLLAGKDEFAARRAEYLKRFIRPRGIERSAGEAVADEVEKFL
ncbi:MAG: hypothetical protein G01um101417_322 [Parcubacteria group bacterium Gr01-1014_17]|nr:MAG: hypothetical protein G01um101417_322 [Parcubacteria group bacterium Gr01-1014_17]